MALLDELFQLDGVTAVAKLDDAGKIIDWKAKGLMTHEDVEEFSKDLEEYISMHIQAARGRPRNWLPLRSMTYSGGDMTIIVAGENLVVAETSKVDMEKLLRSLGILGFASR